MELVTLVDEYDRELGTMEKLQAHLGGDLHRAISVFVFNSRGELLLQQRALGKYHSPGEWSNTCCSHPKPGEEPVDAAARRLMEEMGISCQLTHQFSFLYKAEFENGLTEHEFDHVFFGISDEQPQPNVDEVMDWKYASMENITEDVAAYPDKYTYWLRLIFDRIRSLRP